MLPLSAFWITIFLRCISSFKNLHSDSVKLLLTLSKLQEFKVENQISLSLFLTLITLYLSNRTYLLSK